MIAVACVAPASLCCSHTPVALDVLKQQLAVEKQAILIASKGERVIGLRFFSSVF